MCVANLCVCKENLSFVVYPWMLFAGITLRVKWFTLKNVGAIVCHKIYNFNLKQCCLLLELFFGMENAFPSCSCPSVIAWMDSTFQLWDWLGNDFLLAVWWTSGYGAVLCSLKGLPLITTFCVPAQVCRGVLENMWFSIQTCSCLWTSVVYYSFTYPIVLVVLCSQQVKQKHNRWRKFPRKIRTKLEKKI